MNSKAVEQLDIVAHRAAQNFSRPDRKGNINNETFEVVAIRPLSDHTAAVIMGKSSGKHALFFFYYLAMHERWEYFVPTDSHLLGMRQLEGMKCKVEEHNYLSRLKERVNAVG